MTVLLKKRNTGEFFVSPGIWTEDSRHAFVFTDSASAMEFYMRHYMPDCEVVVVSAEGEIVAFHLDDEQIRPLESNSSAEHPENEQSGHR